MARVLLITANSMSKRDNMGKTFEAILSKFDKSEIAQLFFRPEQRDNIDFDYASGFYTVSEVDIIKSILKFSNKCGSILSPNDGTFIKSMESRNYWYGKINRSKLKRLTLLRDLIWSTNKWKTQELKNWCTDFNPDVILTIPGPEKYYCKVAKCVSSWLNKPIVVYYADDYLLHLSKGIISSIKKFRMNRYYWDMVQMSDKCYAIGEMMASEYTSYFKKGFTPIMNLVNVVPFSPKATKSDKPVISYFGALHLNRWKMISKLAQVIGDKAIICVFTGSKYTPEIQSALNLPNINNEGFVNQDQIRNKMLESDILLHIESDEPYYRQLTHLSVSTKIPEYLITGRLVLGFGPSEVASMRILSDNNIGLVVDSSSSYAEILKTVDSVINSESIRLEYGKRGYAYASSKFDKEKISEEFHRDLCSLNR